MFERYYSALSKNVLFYNFSEENLEYVLSCLKPKLKKYEKNEYIALAGDTVNFLGVIVSGSVSLYKDDYSGNTNLFAILHDGDIFAESLMFLQPSKYPVTIMSSEASEIMLIAKEKILTTCSNNCTLHNTLIRNFAETLSNKIAILNKKIEYLVIKSLRSKLTAFLLDQYKKFNNTSITLQMNRNELADFLNVSRPSMSREMAKMRADGLIDFNKNKIKILDLKKLSSY